MVLEVGCLFPCWLPVIPYLTAFQACYKFAMKLSSHLPVTQSAAHVAFQETLFFCANPSCPLSRIQTL